MRQQDWDFINYVKSKEVIDIDSLNEIRQKALTKEIEFVRLSDLLQRFKKVNFINDILIDKQFEYSNWKTLLAYWTFKRLEKSLNHTLSLDQQEPIISERIMKRFKDVFLNDIDSEIVGVACELNKLIIINSNGRACFEEGLMYQPISDLIGSDFLSIVNKVLNILGINQRINICEGYFKEGENVIKAFYSTLSNPENSVYINFFTPLLNHDNSEQSFRIFISFQNQIPRVANVNYNFENGQYLLKVEEIHDISSLLIVKEQDNPELTRQRLMHELFKTNY